MDFNEKEALEAAGFFLPGRTLSCTGAGNGMMQGTRFVADGDGNGFVVQRLGRHLGGGERCEALCALPGRLRAAGLPLSVPECLPSPDGGSVLHLSGAFFRVMPRLPDDGPSGAASWRSVGRSLALVHGCSGEGLGYDNPPSPRDRSRARLEETLAGCGCVGPGTLSLVSTLFSWDDRHLSPDLGTGTCHGDPKRDNFLFTGHLVHAAIDFEHLHQGPLADDLGECLRSACGLSGWTPRKADTRFAGDVCAGYGVPSCVGFSAMKGVLIRLGFSRARYVLSGRGSVDRLASYVMTVSPFF